MRLTACAVPKVEYKSSKSWWAQRALDPLLLCYYINLSATEFICLWNSPDHWKDSFSKSSHWLRGRTDTQANPYLHQAKKPPSCHRHPKVRLTSEATRAATSKPFPLSPQLPLDWKQPQNQCLESVNKRIQQIWIELLLCGRYCHRFGERSKNKMFKISCFHLNSHLISDTDDVPDSNKC